ncbi:uncharacterized protein EV420DRAFT_754958 [Desarmillaria tabescens]|uniref:Uncharacterized protein n=1 Tax=Armillaria tabescens TaxID=1929756 RepID=A0AA39JZ51_ARMTA|nr:uncharacterized protein EV420DRAFT_754958 [Desarmillaria tabescens]KAK0450431.1 hypothetical protein EV420DRAFT_754958 [Desarmillaria tabescens]
MKGRRNPTRQHPVATRRSAGRSMKISKKPYGVIPCTSWSIGFCRGVYFSFLRRMTVALVEGLKTSVNLGVWKNRNGIQAQLYFTREEWGVIKACIKVILAYVRSDTSTGLILNELQRPRMPRLTYPTRVFLRSQSSQTAENAIEDEAFLRGKIVPLWLACGTRVGDVALLKNDGTIEHITDIFSRWLSTGPSTSSFNINIRNSQGWVTDIPTENYSVSISRPRFAMAGDAVLDLAHEWLRNHGESVLKHCSGVDREPLIVVTGTVEASEFNMSFPKVPIPSFKTFSRNSREEKSETLQVVLISVIEYEDHVSRRKDEKRPSRAGDM